MALVAATQLALLTAGLSLAYVAFAAFVAWRYEGIGVRSLALFSALWGINFFSASLVIHILARYGITSGTELQALSLPSSVQLVLISSTPLSGLLTVAGIFTWLWFVLRYTRRVGRNEKVAIAFLGGFTFVVATLNGLVGALSAFGYLQIAPALESNFHNFASVVEVLGTGVAIGVGIALLYAASQNHRPFSRTALVGLSVPIVLLYLIRYVYQFALVPGFRAISVLRAVGLGVGLLGLWIAVTRHDIFEQLPASRTVGRQTAFDTTDTPIVVVNNENAVSDLNPAARDLFDTGVTDVVGRPLASLLPETVAVDELDTRRSVTFGFPNSDRVVEAETTRTTDEEERSIGRTIVFNEITDERRRQQRIQVLNRVLRHNLRNDINAAAGYLEVIADGGKNTEEYRIRAKTILRDLVTIGNKARDIERVLAADPLSESSHQLSALVTRAVESVHNGADETRVTVDVEVPTETMVRINPLVLTAVVEELVENAIEHAETSVEVSYDTDRRTLVVVDDGPGIPDHEVEVLDTARETSLEHGSGLGLWLVKWGTDMFGGTVAFEGNEDGTRVDIQLPADLLDSGHSAGDSGVASP